MTKGDANAGLDSLSLYGDSLPFASIVGVYSGHRVPIVGLFVIFLQSNAGIITVVSIVYCMLMFDHYHGKCDKAIEERTALVVKTLEYDLAQEKADDVTARFSEELTYKGETYVFEEGEYRPDAASAFLEKNPIPPRLVETEEEPNRRAEDETPRE